MAPAKRIDSIHRWQQQHLASRRAGTSKNPKQLTQIATRISSRLRMSGEEGAAAKN
jgi:hypothetical protein